MTTPDEPTIPDADPAPGGPVSGDPIPGEPAAPDDPVEGGKLPPAAWFGIGLVVVLLAVGIPLLLMGGDDEPVTSTTTTTAISSTTLAGGTTSTSGPATTTTTGGGDTTTTMAGTTTTSSGDTPTTTVAPTTIVTVPPTEGVAPRVYFLAETESSNLPGPHLAAVARPLFEPAASDELLGPIVQSLLDGPQPEDPELAELSSGIPGAVQVIAASVSDGVADIDLSSEFEEGGGTFAMTSRLAQLVFTATQFPDVDSVLLRIEGQIVEVFSSEGIVLDGPQTREDYYDAVLPLVFLDDPAAGGVIVGPTPITGIANANEANVRYELTVDGAVVDEGFTTATCGTGCWGTYVIEPDFPIETEGSGVISVFEESAQDGARINIQSYPVTFVPSG